MKIDTITSPGGLQAWLVEDHTLPLVAVDVAFRGGAAQDPIGRAGLARLMAHLLDEGAGDLDHAAFHEAMEAGAIEIGFHAARDTLHGTLRTLAARLPEAVELFRLAVCEPRFDTEAVERMRQGLLSGLRRELTDPNAMASRAFAAGLFPDHPYGRPVGGSIESMGTITADELRAAHGRLLARDGLLVTIVGAISSEAAGALLDTVFGALPARAGLEPVPDIEPQALGRRTRIELDVPQTVLQFATPGVRREDPDFIPAMVVNHVLGGGAFQSWLFQRVREERGLAYHVSTALAPYRHAALVQGGVATRNDRAAESLTLIESEIGRMASDGPSAEELDGAKRYLTGSYALRFDTSTKIAHQLTQMQLEGLEPDYIERRNGLVDAVTLDDARRVAARLFGGAKPFVVAVGQPAGL